jgi:hypothetical protein
MKARWRVMTAAVATLLGAGTPALGQDTSAPAANEVVGNPQLHNFSLNGTVTVPAPAPRPPVQEPAQRQPAREQARAPSQDRSTQASTARPQQAEPTRAARSDSADRGERGQARSRSATVELPRPTPAPETAARSDAPTGDPAVASDPGFAPAAAPAALDASNTGFPILPWLIAALALIGAGASYFLRQRPRESFAGPGAVHAFDAPASAPAPAPPVRTPPPAPAAKPVSAGVVSTRLRPWIEIEFKPLRAIVDEQKAAIQFELTMFNSGSAPARAVLAEAALFCAGPAQDQQIRAFFDNPVAQGERIPVIPPMQKVSVNSAVYLPRSQVRAIEMEGRQLFIPLVAFNALYSWSGGEGQSSLSYLVGKATQGEKLAPFRLDLGPRMVRNLDRREHELRLRR